MCTIKHPPGHRRGGVPWGVRGIFYLFVAMMRSIVFFSRASLYLFTLLLVHVYVWSYTATPTVIFCDIAVLLLEIHTARGSGEHERPKHLCLYLHLCSTPLCSAIFYSTSALLYPTLPDPTSTSTLPLLYSTLLSSAIFYSTSALSLLYLYSTLLYPDLYL